MAKALTYGIGWACHYPKTGLLFFIIITLPLLALIGPEPGFGG